MAETSASAALAAAALEALGRIEGLNGAYDGRPVKATAPYATIELGPENDWSWKGGEGRELRLAATVRDAGEKPGRLRGLMAAVEAALLETGAAGGWRIVNVVRARARTGQKRAGDWVGVIEVRVRMERPG